MRRLNEKTKITAVPGGASYETPPDPTSIEHKWASREKLKARKSFKSAKTTAKRREAKARAQVAQDVMQKPHKRFVPVSTAGFDLGNTPSRSNPDVDRALQQGKSSPLDVKKVAKRAAAKARRQAKKSAAPAPTPAPKPSAISKKSSNSYGKLGYGSKKSSNSYGKLGSGSHKPIRPEELRADHMRRLTAVRDNNYADVVPSDHIDHHYNQAKAILRKAQLSGKPMSLGDEEKFHGHLRNATTHAHHFHDTNVALARAYHDQRGRGVNPGMVGGPYNINGSIGGSDALKTGAARVKSKHFMNREIGYYKTIKRQSLGNIGMLKKEFRAYQRPGLSKLATLIKSGKKRLGLGEEFSVEDPNLEEMRVMASKSLKGKAGIRGRRKGWIGKVRPQAAKDRSEQMIKRTYHTAGIRRG